MPNVTCAVVGCSNSTYRVKKWKKETCLEHEHVLHEHCGCPRPFHLFCFPSELQNNDQRQLWIQTMKRDNVDGKPWKPGDSDRVCSNHFQDGEPTLANPLPTMGLGYERKLPTPRRKLDRNPYMPKKRKHKVQDCGSGHNDADLGINEDDEHIEAVNETDISQHVIDDHSYSRDVNTPECTGCESKSVS